MPAGICPALSWDSSEGLHGVWSTAGSAAVAFALLASPGVTGAFLHSLSTGELHSQDATGTETGLAVESLP